MAEAEGRRDGRGGGAAPANVEEAAGAAKGRRRRGVEEAEAAARRGSERGMKEKRGRGGQIHARRTFGRGS